MKKILTMLFLLLSLASLAVEPGREKKEAAELLKPSGKEIVCARLQSAVIGNPGKSDSRDTPEPEFGKARLARAIEIMTTDNLECLLHWVIPAWRGLEDRVRVRDILISLAPRMKQVSFNDLEARGLWKSFVNHVIWCGCGSIAREPLTVALQREGKVTLPSSFATRDILFHLLEVGASDQVASFIDRIPDFLPREQLRASVLEMYTQAHPASAGPKIPDLSSALLNFTGSPADRFQAREWLSYSFDRISCRGNSPRAAFYGILARLVSSNQFLWACRNEDQGAFSLIAQVVFLQGATIPAAQKNRGFRKLFLKARKISSIDHRALALLKLLEVGENGMNPCFPTSENTGFRLLDMPELMDTLREIATQADALSEESRMCFFSYFPFAFREAGKEMEWREIVSLNPSPKERAGLFMNAGMNIILKQGNFEKGEAFRQLAEETGAFTAENRSWWARSAQDEARKRGFVDRARTYERDWEDALLKIEQEGDLNGAMGEWDGFFRYYVWEKKDVLEPLREARAFSSVPMRAFCYARYLQFLGRSKGKVPEIAHPLLRDLEHSFAAPMPSR